MEKPHYNAVQRSLLRRLAIMRLHQRRKIVTYSNYANEWNEVSNRFFPIREPRRYKLSRNARELIIRIINLHRACYRYKFAAKFRGDVYIVICVNRLIGQFPVLSRRHFVDHRATSEIAQTSFKWSKKFPLGRCVKNKDIKSGKLWQAVL